MQGGGHVWLGSSDGDLAVVCAAIGAICGLDMCSLHEFSLWLGCWVLSLFMGDCDMDPFPASASMLMLCTFWDCK